MKNNTMNKEQIEALERVIDYLYRDEQKNFQEQDEPENHIFRDVEILAESLWGLRNKDKTL